MKRLTQLQIGHLDIRITEILGALKQKEIDALGPQPDSLDYTTQEKIAMIRNRKAKLNDDAKLVDQYGSTHRLSQCFTYPVSAKQMRATAMRTDWAKKHSAINDRYAAEKQRMMDAAVLGDADEALMALRTLETKLTK